MLSISRLLSGPDPADGSKAGPARYSKGGRPVVVWNLTRSCGLSCAHCYSDSRGGPFPGELTTGEALLTINGLAAFRVPALIFSGGDPLMRPDIFTLLKYARSCGIRTILSTNGVLIDRGAALKIKEAGASYVGVSMDGSEVTNDAVRGVKGAFKKALDGIRRVRDSGLAAGVRFTMSRKTIGELPFIFDLLEKEGIERGYFAHLVYSGRGERFSKEDLDHSGTREAVEYIFGRAADFIRRGVVRDIVTGSNDADGVFLYLRLLASDPRKAETVREALSLRGGNSSGVGIGSIDNTGEVHADQFWVQRSFGNVKKMPFGEIWAGPSDPLLKALRDRKGLVKGRCAGCGFFDMCGGNYRVRAEFSTGDMWAEDPACYLTDAELGIV